jgi:hypothetical protein
MKTLEQMTAAPVPVMIGGIEYRLSPLTGRDIAELDQWARAQMVQVARESVPPDAPAEERETAMATALRAAMKESFFNGFIMDFGKTTRILWTLMRKCHPTVTPADVQELFGRHKAESVEAINTALGMLGGDAKKNAMEAGAAQ